MKFKIIILHKTPLYIALLKGKYEIAKILLDNPGINVNEKSILHFCFFISFSLLMLILKFKNPKILLHFEIKYFNKIRNAIFNTIANHIFE